MSSANRCARPCPRPPRGWTAIPARSTIRAQGLIGRTAARDPFRFRNIHYDVNEYDGDKEILVEADLVNTGSKDMPAPKVRVRVVDADREPLHASVIDPEDMSEMIPAGGSTRYFVRIPEPPSNFEAVLLNVEGE